MYLYIPPYRNGLVSTFKFVLSQFRYGAFFMHQMRFRDLFVNFAASGAVRH